MPDSLRTIIEATYEAVAAAAARRDRAALEQLYLPEFRFVHAFGYEDDRAVQIAETLAPGAVGPGLPRPTFGPQAEVFAYGDVLMHRFRGRTGTGTQARATAIYVRRDGRWQIAHYQATEAVPAPEAIRLTGAVLPAYAGRYLRSDSVTVELRVEGDSLVSHRSGLPGRILTPIGPDLFVDKLGAEWRFERDADRRVIAVTVRGRQGVMHGKRID